MKERYLIFVHNPFLAWFFGTFRTLGLWAEEAGVSKPPSLSNFQRALKNDNLDTGVTGDLSSCDGNLGAQTVFDSGVPHTTARTARHTENGMW
jgi:hypothetical protein